MMKLSLVVLGGALLAGCADTPVRYAPDTLAPQLPTAQLPKLLLEDVVNEAGPGQVSLHEGQTVTRLYDSIDWSEVVRDAVVQELQRLGWPTTESRASAGARLQVTVKEAVSELDPPGFSVPVKETVALAVALKTADGRGVWDVDIKGVGHDQILGGNWPYGSHKAWNEALSAAMTRLSAMLADERPWEKLPGDGKAAVAAAPAPAREQAAPSDIDELPPAGPARPGTYAVVIGVERYRAKLPGADFAVSDARLAAEYFKRVLGVPEDNVVLLTDEYAGKGDFEKYFERWLPNRVQAGDTVYVYYSGHGAPNPAKGDSYLVPYDGDPAYIDQTGFAVQRLLDDLSKLPAKQVYLAMDSCFSGAGGRSVLAQGARPLVNVVKTEIPAKVTVLSASAGDQISNSFQEKGHGLFTYYLLKGLKEKGGDLRAAFDYSKPEVLRVARAEYNSDQVPQWREGR